MSKLWEPYDIPIIGLAGEPDSGKTIWGLTASPDCLDFNIPAPTLVWDTEGSSISYVGILNFDRVDLPKEAASLMASKYRNVDIFTRWKEHVTQLKSGQYQVCMLDTISEIEDGLLVYVRTHPGEFGYTSGQFAKMEGLLWTAVKAEWKRLLMDISQKCETLILTTHMMYEWKGKTATTRRVPKGKETIKHVTSLYLVLSRVLKPGTKQLPKPPSALYGKGRLVRINPTTGQPEPLLPPHIPDASPDGIRKYLKTPPDFDNLKLNERAVPEQILTNDDRLAIQAGIASDENARAQADLVRMELEKEIHDEVKPMVVDTADLKSKILAKVSLQDAKTILASRYNITKLSQLTVIQATDLESHIDSLGK